MAFPGMKQFLRIFKVKSQGHKGQNLYFLTFVKVTKVNLFKFLDWQEFCFNIMKQNFSDFNKETHGQVICSALAIQD